MQYIDIILIAQKSSYSANKLANYISKTVINGKEGKEDEEDKDFLVIVNNLRNQAANISRLRVEMLSNIEKQKVSNAELINMKNSVISLKKHSASLLNYVTPTLIKN